MTYFRWLFRRFENPKPRYLSIAKILDEVQFKALVKMDENRISDALEIRDMYLDYREDIQLRKRYVSVFEVMLGLIDRMMFEMYGENRGVSTSKLFVEMIQNLGLDEFTDNVYLNSSVRERDEIEQIVRKRAENMVKRKYGRKGLGSLFPLRGSQIDTKRTELWYQMMAYLEERY